MNTATSAIKEKIRAILAKAEATEHAGEASVFMAKAVELMEKYQVELFELHIEDPIDVTEGVKAQPGPPSYKSDVQCALAKYYGARPVLIPHRDGKSWHIDICGPESARVTTELMTDFVWAQVGAEATRLVKDHAGVVWKKMNRGMAVREISKALVIRIVRELRERTGTAPAGSSLSLAVVDATLAFMDKHYGPLSRTKGRSKSASQSAMEAAGRIKLNHQFGNKDSLRLH